MEISGRMHLFALKGKEAQADEVQLQMCPRYEAATRRLNLGFPVERDRSATHSQCPKNMLNKASVESTILTNNKMDGISSYKIGQVKLDY